MITRYFLIVISFGLCIYRLTQGAWIPAAGLFAMGAGLVILKIAESRRTWRPAAYVCFAVTVGVIVYMLATNQR